MMDMMMRIQVEIHRCMCTYTMSYADKRYTLNRLLSRMLWRLHQRILQHTLRRLLEAQWEAHAEPYDDAPSESYAEAKSANARAYVFEQVKQTPKIANLLR